MPMFESLVSGMAVSTVTCDLHFVPKINKLT